MMSFPTHLRLGLQFLNTCTSMDGDHMLVWLTHRCLLFWFRAEHSTTGRYIEVSTTEPVFISYSCYYLDFLLKGSTCKDGTTYKQSGGLLFMPQGYPNAVNMVRVFKLLFILFYLYCTSGKLCQVLIAYDWSYSNRWEIITNNYQNAYMWKHRGC